MQIFEIDPAKKYALIFERKLSHAEAERMREQFGQFTKNPEAHFLVIEGARLVKVDEVHAGGDQIVLGTDEG